MKKISLASQDMDILKPVRRCAQERRIKLYLVGGVLRDLFLGRRKENPDFDFCLKRGAIAFARSLAKKMKAGFFVLDKENGAARVVKKMQGDFITFDFTDFRGPTLQEDLFHRDFTVNALALDLECAFDEKRCDTYIIDPWGGREDIDARRIRMVSKDAFTEDPLRILRAFSFSSLLGFSIDTGTIKAAVKKRRALAGVSAERVRDELFKIFSCPGAAESLFHFLYEKTPRRASFYF